MADATKGHKQTATSRGRTGQIHPIVGDAGISLQLRTNVFLGTVEKGERILRHLIEAGDVFVPEVFDGGELTNGRKVRFDPKDLTLPLKVWVSSRYSSGIIAERQHPLESSLHVLTTDFLMFDHLGLNVERKWFENNERIQRFVTVAKDLYSITHANSGYIQNWREERVIGELTDENGNLIGYDAPSTKSVLSGLFWANFFGPEYVEMFGKEKLASAPWYKVEELSDGGALTFISNSPFDASRAEYRIRKEELYTHLGKAAFEGSLLPKFRTEGRKKRDARPLIETGGLRDDVFH